MLIPLRRGADARPPRAVGVCAAVAALAVMLAAAGCSTETKVGAAASSTGSAQAPTVAAPTPPAPRALAALEKAGEPVVVAHRGGTDEGAEGATSTLVEAGKDGFPVEFDLMSLSDGALAVAHDAKVDRILDGRSGRVAQMSRAEWKRSCILGPDRRCEHPALWQDVVDRVPESAVLVPEIKDRKIDVDRFVDSVQAQGVADRVVVQSYELREVETIAAAGLNALYLSLDCKDLDLGSAAGSGIRYLGVSSRRCRPEVVERAHRAGLKIWVYTVNDVETAKPWQDSGADGFFSNAPRQLRKDLKAVGASSDD